MSRAFKIITPLVIIALGAGVMAFLIKNRPAPKREKRRETGALVRVMEVARGERRVVVHGTGTVQPARSVTVIPQASGRVRSMAPALVAGGFLRRGDVIFSIDDADYRLAVERASAAKTRAEYELARMEGRARVARAAWKRLVRDSKGKALRDPNPLVLYGPQLKDARAALKAAGAALEQARLDLERTTLRAPFNAVVVSENVEKGQYVSPAAKAASLAGTDNAEIIVPLPLDDLAWIDLPRAGSGDQGGPRAVVELEAAGKRFAWEGHLIRSLGEVDPEGRMMRVVVSVADPYGLAGNGAQRPPLAFGTFVDVSIDGHVARDVVPIPRAALHDNAVWVVDDEGRLGIRRVVLLRVEREEVLVSEGLADGDRVVLTPLPGAAEGMKLRIVRDGAGGGGA